MGIEYKHWLLASDLSWVGDQSVAARVHAVLDEWGLVTEGPVLYSLDGGRQKKLRGLPGQLAKPPCNLLVEYPRSPEVVALLSLPGGRAPTPAGSDRRE